MRPEPADHSPSTHTAAWFYMSIAVLDYSLIPLAIKLTSASQNPFMFNAAWRLGLSAGYFAFLTLGYRDLLFQPRVIHQVRRKLLDHTILIAAVGSLEFALFALALRYIDPSLATILWELWPIIFIFLTTRAVRGSRKYRSVTIMTVLLLALALGGFSLVVIGESGWPHAATRQATPTLQLATGVALAVAAALTTSLTAFNTRWGEELSDALKETPDTTPKAHSIDLFSVMTAHTLSNLISIPLNGSIGLITGETLDFRILGAAVAGAILTDAIGTIIWRKANLLTNNLAVNALSYATPVFALTWLALFSKVHVARPNFLVAGAAAIITANVLISLETELRTFLAKTASRFLPYN